jgi:protein gp37
MALFVSIAGGNMNKTKIPWATHTFNPVTGCTPVSEGCTNCYSQRILKRFKNPLGVTLHPDRLDEPLKLKTPAKIFVCSMGDLFHEDVPDEFIDQVIAVMALADWHVYLILTKREERMRDYFSDPMRLKKISDKMDQPTWLKLPTRKTFIRFPGIWPLQNLWLGITAENQKAADERIPLLLDTPAVKRFVSFEPLLSRFDPAYTCNMGELDWVIVGGESGPGARECKEEWVQDIYKQCRIAGVPFFFKSKGHNWENCYEWSAKNIDLRKTNWESRREWPK